MPFQDKVHNLVAALLYYQSSFIFCFGSEDDNSSQSVASRDVGELFTGFSVHI